MNDLRRMHIHFARGIAHWLRDHASWKTDMHWKLAVTALNEAISATCSLQENVVTTSALDTWAPSTCYPYNANKRYEHG